MTGAYEFSYYYKCSRVGERCRCTEVKFKDCCGEVLFKLELVNVDIVDEI